MVNEIMLSLSPDIEPSFISTVTPETKLKLERERQLQNQSSEEAPSSTEKTSFSLPGILGSVFKGGDGAQKQATPTDHALPPAPIVAGPAPHEISASAAPPITMDGDSESRPAQVQKQSSVETPTSEKSSFSLPGILGSVFKGGNAGQKQATPTDHALPPAPIVAGPSPNEMSTVAGQPVATNDISEKQKQARVGAPSTEKSSFSLPGILGSVFKGGNAAQKQATPTDHALPPAPIVAGPAPNEISTAAGQPVATNGKSEKQKQARVGAPSTEKSSFSLPGILGSVFKGSQKQATPTDSAHPPGPIIAGPAPHEVSNNGTQGEQVSVPYEVDPDGRLSSSEEPSQFHRTKLQEPVPEPEVRSRSDSPTNQIPMLMSQAVKSSTLQQGKVKEGEAGDDDVVVEGKSSRSKKAKAKRKKKKKKTSGTASSEGDGESSLTTEQAISAFAASLQVEDERSSGTPATSAPLPPAVEREEERMSRKTSAMTISTATTTSTSATMSTQREEEVPVSLDDFVDSFGAGGVMTAQPMPARNDSQGETSKSDTQPLSLADEFQNATGGLTELVNARDSAYDSREPLEPFPGSKPGSVKGSKRNSLAVEDKSLLSDNVGTSSEYDKREERNKEVSSGEWRRRDSDHDLLSPDFVQRDLLSEALDELDRASGVGVGVGGGRGGVMGGATEEREEEEAWQPAQARVSPSENVKNSSPDSDRHRGFRDSSSPIQPTSLDDTTPQDQFEQQSFEKPMSEKHHLSMHKTGNSSPESRNSPIARDGSDQAAAKNSLQSSSDTTIGARKGSAPNLPTASWSTGQYNRLKSLSKKAGSGLKRPKFNRQSSAQERRRPHRHQMRGKDVESLVNEFDIIELPKPRPAPEAPPPAGDTVCSSQDSK